MKTILLGHDLNTRQAVRLPVAAYHRHLHVPGTTGAGKTTALLTMLYQLLADSYHPACHFIVDFLGGLTFELLLWMASPYCPQWVRDRLVLIQPSKRDLVMPMNPLLYDDLDHGFFKVNRAMDLLLRCWNAQSLGEQPRLARWLFNALWGVAQLSLTIADSMHLLLPRSPWHKPMLAALPERLQLEWRELLDERGSRTLEILDSTRNRMKPFFESGVLRSMFGSVANRLNMLHFMREGKIVVLNLAAHGRLAPQEQNAIAGLALNELLATARSLPRHIRYPTYCWLDECQRVVSPDLEFAIPEVRQLDLKLVLAHQSFSQLRTQTVDLTSLIFLPNTRMIFAEQGDDAEILAQEMASIAYDPKRIKEEIYSLKQLQVGHRVVELSSWGTAHTDGRMWSDAFGTNWNRSHSDIQRDGSLDVTRADSTGSARNETSSRGGSASASQSEAVRQQLIAELETIRELASRSYYSFEEQRNLWAQKIRTLRTGECLLKIWNDPRLYHVQVKETRPGPLAFDPTILHRKLPRFMEAYERLLEWNFARDLFVPPHEIERETEERLRLVLKPTIDLQAPTDQSGARDAPFGA